MATTNDWLASEENADSACVWQEGRKCGFKMHSLTEVRKFVLENNHKVHTVLQPAPMMW
jgi:hypothetical protein